MSTSTGVNVLRYSALGLGIFYGIYHQSSLTSSQRSAKIEREYSRKQDLIAQAKAAYLKKTMPPERKTEGDDIITDPNDSRFDLEAYLTMKMADEAKA